jgi:hypothetical protein
MPAREVFGVGRFVVVLGENDPVRLPAGPSKTALFEWREGGLADMGIIGKVAALAMQGSRLSVAGTQTPVETSLRDEAWLAAYEGSTVGWRITRPDEAKGPEDASHDVALDLDGSSSWIVRKYIDMGHALVRVDPDGNPLWTTTLGPSVFGTGTPADSYFAPQVATAGGVTSVAGQLSTTTESSDVLSTLSFRQYDAAGIETRRWNGLTLDEHDRPAVVPVVADADGNVYTLWPMPNRAAPSRPWGFAILRFAGAGDPCVLTEVELARTPTRMVLRGSELLFAAGRIGRVRL